MDQVRIPGIPSIQKLEDYKESELKTMLPIIQKKKMASEFISPALLGRSISGSEVETFQTKGKASFNLIAFFLSFIYNYDLLKENPTLPYFLLCKFISEAEFEFDEQNNEILRARRRKKNHEIVILLLFINDRWLSAIYLMATQELIVVDLQTQKNLPKDKVKTIFDNAYAQTKIAKKYTPQKFTYITQTYTDSTDGTEYYVNYLNSFLNGQLPDKIKFGFSEKRQLRNKLVWAILSVEKLDSSNPQQENDQISQQPSQKQLSKQPSQPSQSQPLSQQQSVLRPQQQQPGKPSSQQKSPSPATNQDFTPASEKSAPKPAIKKGISNLSNSQQLYTQQQIPFQTNQLNTPQIKTPLPESSAPKKGLFSSLFNKKKAPETQSKDFDKNSVNSLKPPNQSMHGGLISQNSLTSIQIMDPKQKKMREQVEEVNESDDEFNKAFEKKTPQKSMKNIQLPVPLVALPEDIDVLDRVKEDLKDYLKLIRQQPDALQHDALRISEIGALNERIQQAAKSKDQGGNINKFLSDMNMAPGNQRQVLNESQLNNYSSIMADDLTVQQMLSDMLDYDDYSDNLNQSLLKRKNYLDSKLNQLTKKDRTKNASQFFSNIDSQQPPAKVPFYPPIIKQHYNFEQTENSSLAAKRYKIKLKIPQMQKFVKDRKMDPSLFNFLINFLQEKIDHHLRFNYENSKAIKFFPLEFYLSLSYYNISSTFKVDYYEASKYTDYTNIFEAFDWLVVPVKEMESEYSLVVVNLQRKALYCFQLSSLCLRIHDPSYINPERNPYMKNVETFINREWTIRNKKNDLGRFLKEYGQINGSNEFPYRMRYEESGLCCMLVMIHLLKRASVDEIKINDSEMGVLAKSFHDLVVRVGYNPDENIFHLLDEYKWPF